MREMRNEIDSTRLDGKQPRAHTQCKQWCDSLLMIKVNTVDIDSNRDRKRERGGKGGRQLSAKLKKLKFH